jgi:superfamily II DNA/RNA helicase/HKD family nuclease
MFITNSDKNVLEDRLNQVIDASNELKFLVGFFYFSGIDRLYNSIKENSDLKINILVGLQVESTINGIFEFSETNKPNNKELIENFFTSVKKSINNEEFDTAKFYEQLGYFIDLLRHDRLIIRKTLDPNHSKLYIFSLKENQISKPMFITGSSNLTRPGLRDQGEFNVDISDYGYEQANEYFDDLWATAIKISEVPEIKTRLIEILENDTHTRKITPYEAYALVLKNYLDSFKKGNLDTTLGVLLEKNGYDRYQYQLDAARQAIAIINDFGGVVIADVVGLGKSVIAGLVANQLGGRGVIICPPGLIGQDHPKSGWYQYLSDFELDKRLWRPLSRGNMEYVEEYILANPDIETIIIDEAHAFKNQDTDDYARLSNICRGKQVMLLTATPFNNTPADLLALLSLFIAPKKSTISLDDNLANKFRAYSNDFNKLAVIKKNYKSANPKKVEEAGKAHKSLFGDDNISMAKVKTKAKTLSSEIRSVIEPITVRRNRLDLKGHPIYSKEIENLSTVAKPVEWFYELTPEQSDFYDRVLTEYFADPEDGGRFTGAVYKPQEYKLSPVKRENLTEDEGFQLTTQRNLQSFMRRLAVKRFESSAKSLEETIKRFKRINVNILDFIARSEGRFIMDRKAIDKLLTATDDEIEETLAEYEAISQQLEEAKRKEVYDTNEFHDKEKFFYDIHSDIVLFDQILKELNELNFVDFDPKLNSLISHLKKQRSEESERKIIIFSEYADTVHHVSSKLEQVFNNRVLTVSGSLDARKLKQLRENFDAKSSVQVNDFDIIVATDKLSEGHNLNRAGMIVNYDIPWNPVRVIQRLGRINRMSKKVFESLYIRNFFPTEKGSTVVKSREIAEHKMFLIHNTLGEDAQIFDVDEEPAASALFEHLNSVDEEAEGESFYTKALRDFEQIKSDSPDLVRNLPTYPRRVKVAKHYTTPGLMLFIRKGKLFVREHTVESMQNISLEAIYNKIKVSKDEPTLPLSDNFWIRYKALKEYKESGVGYYSENSVEQKTLNTLNSLLARNDIDQVREFINNMIEDIRFYGTLPPNTMRFIRDIDSQASNIDIVRNLQSVEVRLGGADYLKYVKENTENTEREVIIAIENQA